MRPGFATCSCRDGFAGDGWRHTGGSVGCTAAEPSVGDLANPAEVPTPRAPVDHHSTTPEHAAAAVDEQPGQHAQPAEGEPVSYTEHGCICATASFYERKLSHHGCGTGAEIHGNYSLSPGDHQGPICITSNGLTMVVAGFAAAGVDPARTWYDMALQN